MLIAADSLKFRRQRSSKFRRRRDLIEGPLDKFRSQMSGTLLGDILEHVPVHEQGANPLYSSLFVIRRENTGILRTQDFNAENKG